MKLRSASLLLLVACSAASTRSKARHLDTHAPRLWASLSAARPCATANVRRLSSSRNALLTRHQARKPYLLVATLDISPLTKHALVPNIVANSVFASLVLRLASHTLSGPAVFHSWVLGLILWGFAGWKAWLIAVLYFATGSAVTLFRIVDKQARSIAEKDGGRRSPANVWGSSLTATACAVLSKIIPGNSLRFRTAILASFATKLADTTSTEIGKAFRRHTIVLPSFKRVPPGTEGGISFEGTVAGAVAASALAYVGVLLGLTSWRGGMLVVVAAMVATTAESVIGSTLQQRFPAFLTNEVVNVMNTMIGAGLAYLAS